MQAARTSQVDFRHNLTTSTNLHEVLNGKQHELLASPVEIIAFSDEEGIRYDEDAMTTHLHAHGKLCFSCLCTCNIAWGHKRGASFRLVLHVTFA